MLDIETLNYTLLRPVKDTSTVRAAHWPFVECQWQVHIHVVALSCNRTLSMVG